MAISRENRKKNRFMLSGAAKKNGFDMWRHSFTGYNKLTGAPRSFFIEFYVVNPGLAQKEVSFGRNLLSVQDVKPSFFMVKAGSWGDDGKQLHSFLPIGDISINKRKLNIKSDSFFNSTEQGKESSLQDVINILGFNFSLTPITILFVSTIGFTLS